MRNEKAAAGAAVGQPTAAPGGRGGADGSAGGGHGRRVVGAVCRPAPVVAAAAACGGVACQKDQADQADERCNQQHEGAEAVNAEANAIRLRPHAESDLQDLSLRGQIH